MEEPGIDPATEDSTDEATAIPKDAPTPEQLERADDLLRRANLEKIRGNKRQAEDLVEEAAAVAPGSPNVLAASADFLVERRQYRKAKELYDRAVALAPNDKAIANRHAELVLATSQFADPDSLLRQAENTENVASAKASAMLSFIVPGLGQVVAGEVMKGLVMFAIWAGALLLFFFLPGVASGFAAVFGSSSGQPPNMLGWLFLGIALITWVASFAERSAAARTITPRKIDKPEPPEEGKGYDY